MPPAHERLDGRDVAGAAVDQRLVEQEQLTGVDAAREVGLGERALGLGWGRLGAGDDLRRTADDG